MQALNKLRASIKPAIEPNANKKFRELVRDAGLDPDNPWIGGYLDREWEHGRHIYETVEFEISGKLFLEFGCNYGATTVVLAALGARVVGVDIDMVSVGSIGLLKLS